MLLPLLERVQAATRVYATVENHFAHWRALPELEFDAEFDEFLSAAIATDDRQEFVLQVMRLLATLRNGHTDIHDEWLWSTHNRSFGFYATRLDAGWIVTLSANPRINVGDEVISIDGVPVEDFYRAKRAYLCLSSERAARTHLFARRFLFPEAFDVEFRAAGMVRCSKNSVAPGQAGPDLMPSTCDVDGTAILRIPSFEEEAFEDRAVELVRSLQDRKAIVVDVRGNGGGSTPMKLVEALMDRPYRMWTEITNFSLSAEQAYQTSTMANAVTDRACRPYLVTPSPLVQPDEGAYDGRLVVLIDEYCNSATEDLLLPLSQDDRAVFIGGATAGSSGQPYIRAIAEGMTLRVGAKRQMFPNGDEFEGVGFAPHVSHRRTVDEIKNGVDGALVAALDVSQSQHEPSWVKMR